MTTEQRTKIMTISFAMIDALHHSGASNAQVLDILSVVLSNEVRRARIECGEAGADAVLERFFKACSRSMPGVGFQLIRRNKPC